MQEYSLASELVHYEKRRAHRWLISFVATLIIAIGSNIAWICAWML